MKFVLIDVLNILSQGKSVHCSNSLIVNKLSKSGKKTVSDYLSCHKLSSVLITLHPEPFIKVSSQCYRSSHNICHLYTERHVAFAPNIFLPVDSFALVIDLYNSIIHLAFLLPVQNHPGSIQSNLFDKYEHYF